MMCERVCVFVFLSPCVAEDVPVSTRACVSTCAQGKVYKADSWVCSKGLLSILSVWVATSTQCI